MKVPAINRFLKNLHDQPPALVVNTKCTFCIGSANFSGRIQKDGEVRGFVQYTEKGAIFFKSLYELKDSFPATNKKRKK